MVFGTFAYDGKIYDIDYMQDEAIKDMVKKISKLPVTNLSSDFLKTELGRINLIAILNKALVEKTLNDIVSVKVNNEYNAIFTSIKGVCINFNENYKYYNEIVDSIDEIIKEYEDALNIYLDTLKFDLENQILEIIQGDTERIIDVILNKDIDFDLLKLEKGFLDALDEKQDLLVDAMEVSNAPTVNIKRAHVFQGVKRFFTGRLNKRKVILKNVLEPLKSKISDFSSNLDTKSIVKNMKDYLEEIEDAESEILLNSKHDIEKVFNKNKFNICYKIGSFKIDSSVRKI